ncbi:hypothetical protein ACFC06_27670 [Nocardia sp. NPDC056064]|uniref:hypothetical protein n=1 Tax=Nocardia sp. NPDC056064 TaxID=3345701 RepID=UPI0035E24CE8
MTSAPLLDSPPRPEDSPRSSRPTPTARTVLIVAVTAILAQLVLRGWVAASGFFYWDDYLLIGRVGSQPLWSSELLFTSHDGHVMPLALALTWLVTTVAPLDWTLAAAVLLLLQALASLAVLRLLLVLLGPRVRLLGPLLFFLFVPLAVPAFAWWAAAVNALPLQIALAWVSADAVLLVRTGRRRYAVSGALVFALALLSFEKSVVVLPVAFAVVVLAASVAGEPVREVARRGAALWTAAGAVLLAWAACFLLVIERPRGLSGPEHPGILVRRALSDGLVPGLFGGPWRWERWQPATPWADPPMLAVIASWIALILFAAWTIRTRRRVVPIWLATIAYAVATIAPVVLLRDGPGTAGLLLQSLRYFADFAVVATIALALLTMTPPRSAAVPGRPAIRGRRVPIAATILFLASSVYSTVTFTHAWEPSPARTYVTGVRASLPTADAPLLPQEVPWNVLNPLAFPENMTDHVFAPLATPTTFALWTPTLRMITDTGEIVDANVWWNRAIVADPGCGHRVRGTTSAVLPLDGPMQIRDWTVQLNYLAERDGRIAVSFDGDTETTAEVRRGLNTVYVRLLGGGSALRIRAFDADQSLCVGAGPVGVISHAS